MKAFLDEKAHTRIQLVSAFSPRLFLKEAATDIACILIYIFSRYRCSLNNEKKKLYCINLLL